MREQESRRIFGMPVAMPSRGDRQESRRFLGFPVGERGPAGEPARSMREKLRRLRQRGKSLR